MKTRIFKTSTGTAAKFAIATLVGFQMACQKKSSDASAPEASTVSTRYIYAVTGVCAAGNGLTTFTAATSSNLVLKINASTGNRDSIIADYSAFPASAGDTPVGIVDWDTNNLLVLVQNGTSGRVEYLPKVGGNRSTFGVGSGVMGSAPYNMIKTSDGGLLIGRNAAIEKVTSTGARLGAPWVSNNLGATCGTTNTAYRAMTTSPSGKIITVHTAATTANRTISVPASGASGSCLAAQAAPQTTAWPVAIVYDSTNNKVLVAYAGNAATTDLNSIYSYDYNDTSGLFTNAQKIYDSSAYPATYSYLLFGISTMYLDSSTNTLYVATSNSTATTVSNYTIEKFSYDASKIGTANSSVLTRTGSVPFYNYGLDTKCISQMVVGN